MNFVDLLIVIAFIAYAIVAGLRSKSAASKSLEEYFLAGRSLKGWQAGLSMAATQFAADTPLLVTGLIATAGIFSLWRLWIYALAFLLMGFILAPSWRRSGVLTDAELTELRYGSRAASWLRGIKAIYFGTIFNCTVLAMVLLAATRIAEPFLVWHQWLPSGIFQPVVTLVAAIGVPLTTSIHSPDVWILSANNLLSIGAIVLVTAFYSTTGGLRSVVATDILQFGIAMLATLFFAWIVVGEAGGWGGIQEKLSALYPETGEAGIRASEILSFTPFGAKDVSFALLAVLALQWLVQMNADGTGYLAQRSMACRTELDAKQASVIFTVAQVFFRSLLWLPLGLGLLVIFPPDFTLTGAQFTSEREFTYVRGIAELLPSGLKGLMLVGMLAALASTVDTHLNWGASYWTNDIYRRFVCQAWLKRQPSSRSLVWVARGANALILSLALLILPALSSIQTAWQVSLLLGAGMGVLLVLRWLWWRINAWGELACIAASLILAPALLFLFPDEDALRLLIMALGSTVAGVLTSLLAGPEKMPRLIEFYRRAHPPGFWAPVARAAGIAEQPQRLARGVGAMLTAAFSIFCLLTGIGSWLVSSPPPSWFPWATAWNILTIGMGLGLFPVWIRLGFGKGSEYLS